MAPAAAPIQRLQGEEDCEEQRLHRADRVLKALRAHERYRKAGVQVDCGVVEPGGQIENLTRALDTAHHQPPGGYLLRVAQFVGRGAGPREQLPDGPVGHVLVLRVVHHPLLLTWTQTEGMMDTCEEEPSLQLFLYS